MSLRARRDPELRPDAIRGAAADIHPAFVGSPQYFDERLSAAAGRDVIVKVECVNPIRSFKGRGTWLAVRGLAGEGRIGADRPVVAASTGNFGQGIAFAARAAAIPAIVVADRHANPAKLDRIRAFGATVVTAGEDFDAAREVAAEIAHDRHGELVTDGQDPRIAAGAATLAMEGTQAAERGAVPLPAAAYVPLGNGALLVGVGAWLRHAAPRCRIVGVVATGAPSMARSWRAGRPIATDVAATYAEGIACRVPVPEALEALTGRVDDILEVDDDAMRAAQSTVADATGIRIEGAAGASWAGLLADPARSDGAALVILTGSNVAPTPAS